MFAGIHKRLLALGVDFRFNERMNLPVYQYHEVKSADLELLRHFLSPEMNQRQPWALDLTQLALQDQLEVIGLVENFFASHNISYLFPYPVYLISAHENTVTRMPLVNTRASLPAFFTHKENKLNVKESQVVGKNKLLQQEIKNCDNLAYQQGLIKYARDHRKIFEQEMERTFYQGILKRLTGGRR